MSKTILYSTPREKLANEDSFINEIMNDEKIINNEILSEYFRYQNSSYLAKHLIKTNQFKNKQIVKQSIDSINDLRNSITRKQIPVNEKPNKII